MAGANDRVVSLKDFSLIRHTQEGDCTVLSGIDLDVFAGQWLVLMGGNGSGKSSLLKFLASDEAPTSEPAAIMFQDPDEQIIARTVDQELSLGRPGLDPVAVGLEFGLEGLGSLDPRLLSAGQKQRLVLAVALAGNPQLLLCDEPVALQDDGQAEWVLDRLLSWYRKSGGALVTATQDMREARRADRVVVLEDGKIILEGKPDDVLGHPAVMHLVGPLDAPGNILPMTDVSLPAVLRLTGVGCNFLGPGGGFRDINLMLKPGSRIGLTGPNGCGKSTLLAVCAGIRPPDTGCVTLGGKELYPNQKQNLDHGVALLAPQFPEYLFTRPSVAAEFSVDPRLAGLDSCDLLEKLGLPPGVAGRNPHSLSSGQRRRLALGLVLFSGRPVLLLDEPTAALDRQGKIQLIELLELFPANTALVIASSDKDFLRAAGCDLVDLGRNPLLQ